MHSDWRRQSGYALVETGLTLALVLTLAAGVALLGEWHGQGLEAAHSSRLLAFGATRGIDGLSDGRVVGRANRAGGEDAGRGYASKGHVSGQVMRPSGVMRGTTGAGFSMPGGATTASLRRGWNMVDDGLVMAYATARAARRGTGTGPGLLSRHTALITGAGHASGDQDTQARIAGNRAAWQQAAEPTRRAGRRIALALDRIDGGWGRPAPEFDWLSRWADLVPGERLRGRRYGPGWPRTSP